MRRRRIKVENKYTIKDLCEKFNITPRTIYYYISIGLLPPAGKRGRGFNFSEDFAVQLQRVLQYRNKVRLSAIPQMQDNFKELPAANKVMTIKIQSNATDFLEYAYDAIESHANSISANTSSMLAKKENQALIVIFPVDDRGISITHDFIAQIQIRAQSYNGSAVPFKVYTSIDMLQHTFAEEELVNE